MDLRVYYQKLRKLEQEISEPQVIVVSQETADGGKAGQRSEVARGIAARLIVEGRARLATAEESAGYRKSVEQAQQQAEQRALAEKVQVSVISEADLRAIKSAGRPERR